MTFYGLLHLNETETSAMNVKVRNFDEQATLYLLNALSLAKSLQAHGQSFCLLTNRADYLLGLIPACTEAMRVEQIEFSSKIPSGIRFYSAHFKFDAVRHLAKATEPYIALIDIDILCLNPMPEAMLECIRSKTPMAYDITSKTPSNAARDELKRDLKKLHKHESKGQWYGGEFISGPPQFFEKLSCNIEKLTPAYFSQIENLCHVGDEMIISAAMEVMQSEGTHITDAGLTGIISRFWNYPCTHWQPSLKKQRNIFLLHLPSDKKFLAKIANIHHTNWQHIFEQYGSYYKSPKQRAMWILRWLKLNLSRCH